MLKVRWIGKEIIELWPKLADLVALQHNVFYKASKSSVCEVQKFFVFIAHLHSVNCHVLENKGLQFYPWWIAITFCGLPGGHYSSHISRLLGVLPSLYGTKHLLT